MWSIWRFPVVAYFFSCAQCLCRRTFSTPRKVSTLTTLQRPLGVSLLAILHVLQAVVLFLIGLVLMTVGVLIRPMMRLYFPRLFTGLLSIIGVLLIILALLYLGFAYGLWTGKGWAWTLALIFAALGIIGSLISLVRGGLGSIVIFVIDVVIIYYLTRPNVKAFFGKGQPTPTPTPFSPPLAAQATQPPSQSIGAGRHCSNCGAPLTSEEKFCLHCGSRIP
jgi:hypothetical protein